MSSGRGGWIKLGCPPWQTCAKTADEYGRIAKESAKIMRWVDDSIELAACGSSGRNMETFGAWEYTVLEHCFDEADWISLHTYINNYAEDTAALLAAPDLMDSFIEEVVAIADAVAAKRRSSRRIMLSFDEWNVWYRTRRPREARTRPGWPVAPPILEEAYNVQDALAFGGMAISLLNHADRVRCACLAQLVNVIAPIMTETGGPCWRQTIFWPFAHFSNYGHGRVLRGILQSETYEAAYYDPRRRDDPPIDMPAVPYVKAAAVAAGDGGLTVFALNRSLDQEVRLAIEARGFGALRAREALTLHEADLNAVNTRDEPDRVRPRALEGVVASEGKVEVRLPTASWNVIRLDIRVIDSA